MAGKYIQPHEIKVTASLCTARVRHTVALDPQQSTVRIINLLPGQAIKYSNDCANPETPEDCDGRGEGLSRSK